MVPHKGGGTHIVWAATWGTCKTKEKSTTQGCDSHRARMPRGAPQYEHHNTSSLHTTHDAAQTKKERSSFIRRTHP